MTIMSIVTLIITTYKMDSWKPGTSCLNLGKDPDLTWDFVKNHLDKTWNWMDLSRHPMVTIDIVKESANAFPERRWDWFILSENLSISWEDIDQNPELPWDWYAISKRPDITWDIITQHPEKPWEWFSVSSNQNITEQIVLDNLHYPWNPYGLDKNPNVTDAFIDKHIDSEWFFKKNIS